MAEIRIGTAGWSIAGALASEFPSDGSTLERYAARFGCAEINSSFHRSHRPTTWAGWAASAPQDFAFSAKLPKEITHMRRLVGTEDALDRLLEETEPLGDKLRILLVQLPPSLAFDSAVASAFFAELRRRWSRGLACEPRHASWFSAEAGLLLRDHEVARVAADPPPVPEAAEPSGWSGLLYYRLHGSPAKYRSSYDDGRLEPLAARLAAAEAPLWCIFDNTASSAAAADALKLKALLGA
jgi:uncharacterized protein YecE (DUF72 family)